jgi:hypothetical protein
MLKHFLKTIFPVISLTALFLSACNAPATVSPTEAVSAIYTAAAETIVAQQALATATPTPTKTATPTQTALPVTATQPASPQPTTAAAQNFCDNSIYISDVTIPDKTVILPGQVFEKTWALQNTGSCTWTEGYTIVSAGGDLMGGTTRPIPTWPVAPQQQTNVTVKLTAPNTAGTYTGWWRLSNSKGAPFGQSVSVVIVVGGTTTATATLGTVTATNIPAITLTATNIPAITLTPTTAAVSTATETPTTTAIPIP